MTDWLKPGAVPPDAATDLQDDDAMSDDTTDDIAAAPEPSAAQRAGGSNGTTSGDGSSRDNGEGTHDTLGVATDSQSQSLRDAPGGPR